jgi:hypothetical protein
LFQFYSRGAGPRVFGKESKQGLELAEPTNHLPHHRLKLLLLLLLLLLLWLLLGLPLLLEIRRWI